jgi:hypothetical protein
MVGCIPGDWSLEPEHGDRHDHRGIGSAELVARALHKHSPRTNGPFVAINTAAIPKDPGK